MAAELVHAATSEKLNDMDWGKNIKICELVAQDPRHAKDVIKQIKKRLGSKNTTRQLFSVMLLEMLMNNIGEDIHRQVIGVGLLPLLVKIVKKKSDLPLRERIYLLLDATQTSLGGASGKFPQYYAAYNDLVSTGVQFSLGPETITSIHSTSKADDGSSSGGSLKSNDLNSAPEETSQIVNESSIIEKACNTLEVLKEVIDAADAQNYGAAKDEFTLDLVEQCSFQKQRVMQLVLTSKDEKLVSRAIELNEDFQKVLARHDALLSVRPTLNANDCNHEETEEEEVEQLFRRIRKGKACAVPENEAHPTKQPSRLADDGLHRPLTRPLCIDPLHDSNAHSPGVVIPPPPLKHVERARFFQENKVDGMKALPLHSRNTSSSHSGSLDSSEWHETG